MNAFSIFFEGLLILETPVSVILVILAYTRKSTEPLIALGLLFAVGAFNGLMLTSANIYPLISLDGFLNWQGFILSILWPLILVFVFKWLSPEDVGLKISHPKNSLYLGLLFGGILGGWNFLDEYLRGTLHGLSEATLFMLTMPGLSEELVYRGVLLAILDRYLGKPWHWDGIRFGWGIVLVSMMFIQGHLFRYSDVMKGFIWTGNVDLLINVTVATVAFAYLRLKTRSIWPGVLCHSMIDVAPFLSPI
ncbi:MAG: CPBP family intramembrane metalloprotease [Gammaproteobacteria bacterium]|nr:CPBP family intramembrane metalloprotease [Gammaproteobacteria bacterium]